MHAETQFPFLRPNYTRLMAVGEGHTVYTEECGTAYGQPVVFLHGGPGQGGSPALRSLFDPRRYRIILPDQRGCGHSQPHGATEANTTTHLVADLEYLREALGIPEWIVFGSAWGGTLALAYAEAFPERVRGLVLRGVFFGSHDEIQAYIRSSGKAAPAAWKKFVAAIPKEERDDLLAAYARRILGENTELALAAARAWLDYERALNHEPPLAKEPDDRALASTRVKLHYLRHDCFIAPNSLLNGIERIRHLPAAIIHGATDPLCPPSSAQMLRQRWPEANWLQVPDGACDSTSAAVVQTCIDALDWVMASHGE